ncbi:MAG: cupin domain-containing protein [Woeseiaceae bacterium]|nr:cupin domain-containing protein [Woeseiaceae bacterium]
MKTPTRFDARKDTVGVSRDLCAAIVAAQADPPIPVDGLTIGVADMSENSPHGGEMHPDGDEVLYLISGLARVVFENSEFADVDLHPGDGLVVPKGVWHRVDILKPCRIVYATPGPGGEYRPL